MSRGGFKINRQSYDYVRSERVPWLDEFADNIERASTTAVEVARQRGGVSYHDQVSSIVNDQSAHTTVESLVNEIQERVGLKEYMQRVSEQEQIDKTATAAECGCGKDCECAVEIRDILSDLAEDVIDKVTNYCQNFIATHRGHVAVPAVQHEILAQFRSDVPEDKINDEKFAKYISNLISEELQLHPQTDTDNTGFGLGVGLDLDSEKEDNDDVFEGLMPNTGR